MFEIQIVVKKYEKKFEKYLFILENLLVSL